MDRSAPANVGSDHLKIEQRLVRQAARQFLAVVQHQHLVCEVANELHVVLDPDHGRRELVPDAQEVARQILLLLPIEAADGSSSNTKRGPAAKARASPPYVGASKSKPYEIKPKLIKCQCGSIRLGASDRRGGPDLFVTCHPTSC